MLLQKHTTSELELHYTFVQRRQQETEDVEEFGNVLVELANKAYKDKCKELRQELIRDQFIQGLKENYIQERLLQEQPGKYAQPSLLPEHSSQPRKQDKRCDNQQPGNSLSTQLIAIKKCQNGAMGAVSPLEYAHLA